MIETLIDNFLRISKIPRKSGNEEKIADFFVNVAKTNNLYYFKDKNNNVLIKKKGNINSKPLALQAHLDMVCVKNGTSNHDFKKDGIEVIIDGDKVTAKDTTLGADQGVGLAMMLTIIEDNNLKHPDLEFIFTTEEETTFNGVVNFSYSKVESKRLINLDNSKDDTVFTGADGDILNEYSFKGTLIENQLPCYKIKIDGFPGGNSGDNIDLSKNNAITTMARILEKKDILLCNINGGTFENDLATFCEVTIATNLDVEELFCGYHTKIEPLKNQRSFTKKDTENIINEILELKSGFISSDNSSANLGVINTNDNEIKIKYIMRSIEETELENINRKTKELQNNFKVTELYRDPIWKVDKNSELLSDYKKLYFKEYKEYPKEEIGHGSTEVSSIKKRINGLDAISIGSNMEKIHTTEEITYLSSWIKMYNLLTRFIELSDK